MNRQHKYRIWQDWSEVNEGLRYATIDLADKSDLIMLANEDIIGMDEFTGLHDKNDKEIFEGDIVKVERNDSFSSFNKGKVIFNHGHFIIIISKKFKRNNDLVDKKFGKKQTWMYLTDWEGLEILGNIYQNPELQNE